MRVGRTRIASSARWRGTEIGGSKRSGARTYATSKPCKIRPNGTCTLRSPAESVILFQYRSACGYFVHILYLLPSRPPPLPPTEDSSATSYVPRPHAWEIRRDGIGSGYHLGGVEKRLARACITRFECNERGERRNAPSVYGSSVRERKSYAEKSF